MAYQPNQLSFTQNSPLQFMGVPIASASTTASATLFGSSIFLQRMYIPGPMALTEVDMAVSIAMVSSTATSTWGNVTRNFAVYAFSNNTLLTTFLTASQTYSFNASSATSGAVTAVSNVVGGWSQTGGIIIPMTFSSSYTYSFSSYTATTNTSATASVSSSLSQSASYFLPPGDYVFAHQINFSGVSTAASMSLFGVFAGSVAFTTVNFTSIAMAAGSGVTGTSRLASQFIQLSTAGTMTGFSISQTASSATASFTQGFSSAGINLSVNATAASESFAIGWNSTGLSTTANPLTSIGVIAGSHITGSTITTAISSVAASRFSQQFNYLGISSGTLGAAGGNFVNGLLSSGSIPASLTLTGAGLTTFGSAAYAQPWFALFGS